VIAFKYTELDLEVSNECASDFVEVYDGAAVENATRVDHLCGRQAPERSRKSTGNRLLVRFVTDYSVSHGSVPSSHF
jgi:hypothetical protein